MMAQGYGKVTLVTDKRIDTKLPGLIYERCV